jgi:hypothetical protein
MVVVRDIGPFPFSGAGTPRKVFGVIGAETKRALAREISEGRSAVIRKDGASHASAP